MVWLTSQIPQLARPTVENVIPVLLENCPVENVVKSWKSSHLDILGCWRHWWLLETLTR